MSSSATKLYIGRISPRTSQRTLERLFDKYGRVVSLTIKGDFGFVEFEDDRDADDAIHYLDGVDVDGQRIVVERSRSRPFDRGGGDRGGYGDRGGGDRGSRTFSAQDKCYNCGMTGHWANECRSRDWGNRCYNCGGTGHIRAQCPDPPKGGGFGARDKEVDPRAPPAGGRHGGPSRDMRGGGGGAGYRSRSRSRGRGRGGRSRTNSRSRSRSRSRGGRDSRSRSRGRDRSGSRSRSPRVASRSPKRSASRSPKRSRSPAPRDD